MGNWSRSEPTARSKAGAKLASSSAVKVETKRMFMREAPILATVRLTTREGHETKVQLVFLCRLDRVLSRFRAIPSNEMARNATLCISGKGQEVSASEE